MIYVRYIASVLFSLFITVVTWVLSPVLAALVKSDGNLPNWLYWFQTFDNTCDAGWKVQGNYGTYLQDGTVPTGITLWWYRLLWLCRNPAYGWDYWPLGIAWDKDEWTVIKYSSQDANPNFYYARSSQGYFSWTYSNDHIQLKFGWKSWGLFDRATGKFTDGQFGPEKRQPLCFTIVPRF